MSVCTNRLAALSMALSGFAIAVHASVLACLIHVNAGNTLGRFFGTLVLRVGWLRSLMRSTHLSAPKA